MLHRKTKQNKTSPLKNQKKTPNISKVKKTKDKPGNILQLLSQTKGSNPRYMKSF